MNPYQSPQHVDDIETVDYVRSLAWTWLVIALIGLLVCATTGILESLPSRSPRPIIDLIAWIGFWCNTVGAAINILVLSFIAEKK